jgi:hypothetical protein
MSMTIRMYLFNYHSHVDVAKFLKVYWAAERKSKKEIEYELTRANEYGKVMVQKGQCSDYHLIVGED